MVPPSKILKSAFLEFGAILFSTGQILPLTLARLPIGKGRNMKGVVRLYPISKPKQKSFATLFGRKMPHGADANCRRD